MNIQLLKASDFNGKLRERGIPKNVTVRKMCRVARDENEVWEILELVWRNPHNSEDLLTKIIGKEIFTSLRECSKRISDSNEH